MFYTETLLSKKGKLAKVWLAAHWERKLSKSQFLQTDVKASVESIIQTGQQPMALRLSGQLLLGVTRIYSRKARYLLEDCNEALVKIKMAFRPGVVDMPGDHATANINAITLGDAITEFDILLPEPSFDLSMFGQRADQLASQTVSRTQDITLAEPSQPSFMAAHEELQDMFGIDLSTTAAQQEDDGWNLNLGFGEEEIPRGGDKSELRQTSLEEESLEVERGRDAVSERPYSPRRESMVSLGEPSMSTDKEASFAADMSFNLAEAADTMGGLAPMDIVQEEQLPFPDIEMPPMPAFGEDESSFRVPETVAAKPTALEEAAAAAKSKKQPRKRKLVVDAQTELPSQLIQQQLRDTSDITQQERYVPNSRKMQRLLEIRKQGAAYYLQNSILDGMPPELHILFQNKWRDAHVPDVASPAKRKSVEPAAEEEQEQEQHGQVEEMIEQPMDFELPSFPPEESLTSAQPVPESLEPQLETDRDSAERAGKRRRTESILPEDVTEVSPPIDEADFPEDTQETEANEAGFSKNTVGIIKMLQGRFEGDGQGKKLSYEEMTTKAKRTDAVKLFFELLVLKTKDMVEVEQEEAYGDILIASKDSLWTQESAVAAT